jgi:hypothetical protein
MKNVLNEPLINPKKGLLPPLHIKLGLMKSFARRMKQEGEACKYLSGKFPRLSDAIFKDGIFIGLQIWELLRDHHFD